MYMQKSLLSLMDMQSPWSCITQYFTPMANTAVSESKTVKSAQPRKLSQDTLPLEGGVWAKNYTKNILVF